MQGRTAHAKPIFVDRFPLAACPQHIPDTPQNRSVIGRRTTWPTLCRWFGKQFFDFPPEMAGQLKIIYIPEFADEYSEERDIIQHDIDILLDEQPKIGAREVWAILIIMLANRVIWESESKARAGGAEQDANLKFTHSVNGVRNHAKNIIAEASGGRKDYKIDCLAEDISEEFGNWNIFK